MCQSSVKSRSALLESQLAINRTKDSEIESESSSETANLPRNLKNLTVSIESVNIPTDRGSEYGMEKILPYFFPVPPYMGN
jgi:hypothetical protein